MKDPDRVVLTPLAAGDEVSKRFLVFEKRVPRLGVHLGFRRDLRQHVRSGGVATKPWRGGKLMRFVFEGAMRNYPNPEVEKDNVNYLAGVS